MFAIPLTFYLPILFLLRNHQVTSFILDNKPKTQSDCDIIISDNVNVIDNNLSDIPRHKRQIEIFSPDHFKLNRIKVDKDQLLKYLLVPALIMSGLIPYILPPIKMAVMIVSLMTNMAFTSALFSLIRSYIFDPRPEEDNVVYYNLGYKKDKTKPIGNNFQIVYPDDENNGSGQSNIYNVPNVPIDVSVAAADQFQKINQASGSSLVLPPAYDSVNNPNTYVSNGKSTVEQTEFNKQNDYGDIENINDNRLRWLK